MSEDPEKAGMRLSRRMLIRLAGWLTALPVPLLFASMVDRQARVGRERRNVTIVPPQGDGVSFTEDAIVCRSGADLRVFSSRCPHLGCRIAASADGFLVCPCHGSRFRSDGAVAAGPAARPLDRLPFTVDPHTGVLTVHVG